MPRSTRGRDVSRSQPLVLAVALRQSFALLGSCGGRVCGMAVLVCLLTASLSLSGSGQEAAVSRPSNAGLFPDSLEGIVLPLRAELYLQDGKGSPVFVPNVKFDEIRQFSERSTGLANGYQFGQIDVDVVVTGMVADITGSFSVRLDPGIPRADIGLAFGSCQLGISQPDMILNGATARFYADSSGYRWAILPASGGVPIEPAVPSPDYSIALSGKSRIVQELDRRTLRISLPQHNCRIKALLPVGANEIEVRTDEVVERQETDSGLELTILSRGGDFSLSWRGADSSNRMSSVEATSKTTFEIDEPQQIWRAKTNLVVRWYGNSPTTEFRLSIPDGASWITNPLGNNVFYSITATEDASGRDLIVRLFKGFETTSISLDLEWVWRPQATVINERETNVIVPALAVTNVGVHSGTIEFRYPSAFSAVFSEGGGTRLMRQGPTADGFGIQNSELSFSRQPFELTAIFREEKSLPNVRPTYHVAVDRNKLVMTAWLDCSFDVNQPRLEMDMDFGTWNLRLNTAKALSDAGDPFTSEGDALNVIPLQDGTYRIIGNKPDPSNFAANRRIEQIWRLTADRDWSPDDNNELSFAVPRIDRDPLGDGRQRDYASGTLIVSGDDNILLQWNETASAGELLPDTFSSEYQPYVARDFIRKPMVYRFPSMETIPSWAGKAQILPQVISAVEDVDVQVLGSQIVLTQAYEVQIANEPLKNVQFAVRSDIAAGNPRFFVGGIITSAELVSTISGPSLQERLGVINDTNINDTNLGERGTQAAQFSWNIYELIGAPELSGNSSLSVESSMAWEPASALASSPDQLGAAVGDQTQQIPTRLTCPLALPMPPLRQAVVRRNISLRSEYLVELETNGEALTSGAVVAAKQQLPTAANSINLTIETPDAVNRQADVTVGRSWLQTAIDGRRRQDRFVVEFESQADELTFKLPKQAFARNPTPTVMLDGEILRPPTATYVSTDDSFVIRLPESGEQVRHTLELFYSVNSRLTNWTSLTAEPPILENAEHVGRFYWQLITPQTNHLANCPNELTAEWQWRWGGLGWYRDSSRDERALVQWLNAYEAEALPASCNRYLMSGQFPQKTVSCLLISRIAIWFPIGSLAIALTTLVINIPALRKPVFGLILAGIIATLAAVLPDLGVLVGQTVIISLGLAALVFSVQAAIDSRVRRRSVFGGRSSTLMESSNINSAARMAAHTTAVEPRLSLQSETPVSSQGGK